MYNTQIYMYTYCIYLHSAGHVLFQFAVRVCNILQVLLYMFETCLAFNSFLVIQYNIHCILYIGIKRRISMNGKLTLQNKTKRKF